MIDVLVIAGSKSDSKIIKKATDVLDELGISYEVQIASAHREPEKVKNIIKRVRSKVIIAIAGMAAALPGVIASYTKRPVIGVPVSSALGGLDALLSIVQMPKGVPVATVGIDNGQNAAYLAARIIGVSKNIPSSTPKTYAESGVDESRVERGLKVLGEFVKKSFQHGNVMQDYGHYANTVKITDDLCIALSTDGVGSKVLIAEMANRYDTIGIDCVAMNVNDLLCVGVTPVGFVDYLAIQSPLSDSVLEEIGKGLLQGCREADIPILGGETAVLPDIIRGVSDTGLDLAGTAVGTAHPDELIDGSTIKAGDCIIGIASNGIHSNGFTLARKVILSKYNISDELPWKTTVEDELLRPTRVYVKHFKALKHAGVDIKGLAHITGSGFKKILRLGNHRFRIEQFPKIPPIFSLVKEIGGIEWKEMFSTFNMGIGFIVVVAREQKDQALKVLNAIHTACLLGEVEVDDFGCVEITPYEVKIP